MLHLALFPTHAIFRHVPLRISLVNLAHRAHEGVRGEPKRASDAVKVPRRLVWGEHAPHVSVRRAMDRVELTVRVEPLVWFVRGDVF